MSYCRDETVRCSGCGKKQSVKKLIKNGQFDIQKFEDCSDIYDYNPFEESKEYQMGNKITLTFECNCPDCGEYLEVCLVCKPCGFDVFNEDLAIVESKDTFEIKGEDE